MIKIFYKVYRLWHTIRFLKSIQIYRRLWFNIWKPKPILSPRPTRSKRAGIWQPPAKRQASITGPRSFQFLNKEDCLERVGWDGPLCEKLWRYHQHYFDDLNAVNSSLRRNWQISLIEDWIEKNPVALGTGWEPYPLSLRIINLIKLSLSGQELNENILQSLSTQIRWLTKRLEYHLLGNHLFTNAKALVMAGLFFDGKEPELWLNKGFSIITNEIPKQFLPDGGHFELSPMYHALALEDMLDLINITNCFFNRTSKKQKEHIKKWSDIVLKMYHWLKTMCHSDKKISFFNDAVMNITPSIEELENYFFRLLPNIQTPKLNNFEHLKDSGYIRLSYRDAIVILDVANIGPNYLPAHSHADTLSFEFSFKKHRILVNSGISSYEFSQERLRQRGTAAHNTVVINEQNSSDVWHSFRVGKRAFPYDLKINKKKEFTEISCKHSGYHNFKYKNTHNRTWIMKNKSLTIIDNIDGLYRKAEARFHFHPDIILKTEKNKMRGKIILPNEIILSWHLEQGIFKYANTTWHPEFGLAVPNKCLVIMLKNNRSKLILNW